MEMKRSTRSYVCVTETINLIKFQMNQS